MLPPRQISLGTFDDDGRYPSNLEPPQGIRLYPLAIHISQQLAKKFVEEMG